MKCINCEKCKKCNPHNPFYVGCYYVISTGFNNQPFYNFHYGEKYLCMEKIDNIPGYDYLYQVYNISHGNSAQYWLQTEVFKKMFYNLKEERKLKLEQLNENR